MKTSRRSFLAAMSLASGGILLSSLSRCFGDLKPYQRSPNQFDIGPIDREATRSPQVTFSGDSFDWPHHVIRDGNYPKDGAPNGRRVKDPKLHDVIIIGAGMAGMVAAWKLREFSPLVIEQAARLGGNSRGESWMGTDYSIGAAYITNPEPGGEIDLFLKEIDAYKFLVESGETAPVILNQQRVRNFWEGYGDSDFIEASQTLKSYLLDVYNEHNGRVFPEIPFRSNKARDAVLELDKYSFYDLLKSVVKKELPPEIYNLVEHYCWSSFGASSHELSAAAGVNFYSCEFDSVWVAPGGNAGIVERIYHLLPEELFRVSELVFHVSIEGSEVLVKSCLKDGTVNLYRARTVVFAAPKFVASRVIANLEPRRLEAIAYLQYRAYLVANVLLNRTLKERFYDLYFSSKDSADLNAFTASEKDGITDVILANFADRDGKNSVLSLYRAYPFNGGRGIVFGMDNVRDVRNDFARQIYSEILPLFGCDQSNVSDIRLTRWGHAMPVAERGIYRKKLPEILSAVFQDRVFFAEQDNWALPCFETACTEGLRVGSEVNTFLRG